MGQKENEIKKEILQWLNLHGVCWNVNNGKFKNYNMSKKGSADIQGAIWWRKHCIPVQVEVKTVWGKMSTSQKVFKTLWEQWGFFYCCATCIEDVEEQLDIYVKERR